MPQMREVISNTSPLQYLLQLRLLELLQQMYTKIIVPRAVADEIDEGLAAGIDLPRLNGLTFVDIRAVEITAAAALLADLGAGEAEAITLARQTPDSLLILDDRVAREHA